MLKLTLILIFICTTAFCVDGVDFGVVEGILNIEQVKCLLEEGKTFAIMQLWRSNGLLNPYFTVNYETMMALGLTDISAYAFICNMVNTPEQICPGIVAALPIGFKGKIWLDIEPEDNCWNGTTEEKIQFAENVATTCRGLGLDMGVYSCRWCWNGVFGSDNVTSTVLNQLPLWYAHFDYIDELGNDYQTQSFSGWTSAVMKQYAGMAYVCGATLDLSVY